MFVVVISSLTDTPSGRPPTKLKTAPGGSRKRDSTKLCWALAKLQSLNVLLKKSLDLTSFIKLFIASIHFSIDIVLVSSVLSSCQGYCCWPIIYINDYICLSKVLASKSKSCNI